MPDPLGKPESHLARQRWTCAGAIAVGVAAALSFGLRLSAQPHFVDESAYISQTYFLKLLARPNHPYWLEYPAYDLPPLPKYLIGLSLRLGGQRLPPHEAMKRWYQNTSRRFTTDEGLWWARLPSAAFGGLGCAAIFGLGTMVTGRRLGGLFAAALLMVNPLYRMHARRAMSDVPAEALILTTLAIGMIAWRAAAARRLRPPEWMAAATGMGFCGGLAVLAKLNGGLGLMVLGAWSLLEMLLPGLERKDRRWSFASATIVAAVVAFGTFAALNPFLWSRPHGALPARIADLARRDLWARTRVVIDHRSGVSREAMLRFPDDALRSLSEKARAVGVQGFGRFGPFGAAVSDSRRRYDWSQDYGAPIWLAWVLAGAVWSVAWGARQLRAGQPPTAFAALAYAIVALVTVTAFVPLAWDRYFLSIQPPCILLASSVAAAAFPRRSPAESPGVPGAEEP